MLNIDVSKHDGCSRALFLDAEPALNRGPEYILTNTSDELAIAGIPQLPSSHISYLQVNIPDVFEFIA